MTTERKLFTAEIKRMQQQGASAPNASNAEVLKAINELRADLAKLALGEMPAPVVAAAPVEDSAPQKAAEVSMLKTELRALAVCIEHTKAEIAALRPKDADDDRLIAVTFELDAIVSSTESATEQILEAAEKIETIAKEIQAHAADGYVSRLVEDIGDTVSTVFEACNFQDITGQRITKVVKALKDIEDRVESLVKMFGAEFGDDSAKTEGAKTLTDQDLLNGPQLPGNATNQADIDALLASFD